MLVVEWLDTEPDRDKRAIDFAAALCEDLLKGFVPELGSLGLARECHDSTSRGNHHAPWHFSSPLFPPFGVRGGAGTKNASEERREA